MIATLPQVLGLSSPHDGEAPTETEIKKAYRTMAKKYHPDKLIDMDEAYKKGAEQKFREVQESYESLQKERGF